MTQNLTERLKTRLSTQTAEIEALTRNELEKLASNLRAVSEAELKAMRSAIHMRTVELNEDLENLRRFGRWWWTGLAATWLMIAGYSAWQWMNPPGGIGLYQTFAYENRTYLLLPDGSKVLTCRDGTTNEPLRCAVLPEN